MMIRSILILAAITAFVADDARGTPRVVSPSVLSIHPDPVWYEWDALQEENRIPNPTYRAPSSPGSIAPVTRACHVRDLQQGSGSVRVCE